MASNADQPIEHASEDLLHRGKVARSIADNLRVVDARRGYVFGVLGPWGSGKTSLINLVREQLATAPEIVCLDFNPWMFSGSEQLMGTFFLELSAQLRLKGDRFGTIADGLDAYLELLAPLSMIPVVGYWLQRARSASTALKRFRDTRKGSIQTRRADLESHLARLATPLVVILDDIDRLTTPEIREIFKLVRLTASFPNIIYVLAFDRKRVEHALNEDGVSGRDYLEKILQTTIDIPRLPEKLLLTTFSQAVDEAVRATGAATRFDPSRWPDVLAEIVWPLITTMRDVRRYASSIDAAVREMQDEIELVDILALEAVRIFMPDTFAAIQNAAAILTRPNDSTYTLQAQGDTEHAQLVVKSLLTIAEHEGHRDVARDVVGRIFPAARRHVGGSSYGTERPDNWPKAHRVAHPDFLRRYLERFAGESIDAFFLAEQLHALMTDQPALQEAVDAIDPAVLEDVIAALEAYETDFRADAVLPATVVLLNKLPTIPGRERAMLQLDTRLIVVRVILRLLRRLSTPDEVRDVVGQALPQLTSLYSRLVLIMTVGHQEGVGLGLVSETVAHELESGLADEVVASSAEKLAAERIPLYVLQEAQQFGADIPHWLENSASPELIRALLISAQSESLSQSFGSRAVQRRTRLAWELLEKLFGGLDRLTAAIDVSRHLADADPGYTETLALADRYRSGWRPRDFGGDE